MPTTNEAPGQGVYYDIPADVYHSWPYASGSGLKLMAKSAAKLDHHRKHPEEDDITDAMAMGSATHTAVLEPDEFDRMYAVAPEGDKRTKVVKEAWKVAEAEAAESGRALLRVKEYDLCRTLRDRIWNDELAGPMLSGRGRNEVSVVWQDEATGLMCKARIDRLCDWMGFTCHIDLKTTQDASPWGYPYECRKYKYHWSAAFYLKGCEVIHSATRRFLHIAIEKEPPYDLGVYEFIDGDHQLSLDSGWLACQTHLATWKQCVDSGVWPSHGGPHPLEL